MPHDKSTALAVDFLYPLIRLALQASHLPLRGRSQRAAADVKYIIRYINCINASAHIPRFSVELLLKNAGEICIISLFELYLPQSAADCEILGNPPGKRLSHDIRRLQKNH